MSLKATKRRLSNPLTRDACLLGSVILGIIVLSIALMHHAIATQPQFITVSAEGAAHGRDLFVQNCASCHGLTAQGMPHQGANLRASPFILHQTDYGLIKFLRVGRQPEDPFTVMNLQMPAKGGNMTLGDEHLADIVAYLRKVQKNATTPAGPAVAPIAAPSTRPTFTMTPSGQLGG